MTPPRARRVGMNAPSLAVLLDGLEASTLSTLARNDIRSIEDLQALSAEDFRELGVSVGHRNRLQRRITLALAGHAAAGARAAVVAEQPRDGEQSLSCGHSCLRFALDEKPQACAADSSNRTTAAEAAALANPAMMDVAPFRVAVWRDPTRHVRIPVGVAVATALYQARNTSRFTSGAPSDVAPCAALAQMRALRHMGGFEVTLAYMNTRIGCKRFMHMHVSMHLHRASTTWWCTRAYSRGSSGC